MSAINLEDAKAFLDVIHEADDGKLQILLDAAEDEALQFIDAPYPYIPDSEPVSEPALPASFVMGVLLLLQANYQATPDDARKLRDAAEIKLMPFRCGLGV
ncbi:head-tail connector protein [Advenella mimigardefordensis]|uniref:Phage gp6-like head-tail connector protein n=1 Tax=Advenella mimigardefordensis (strain DSM 17166 / LMG 22922 / DPN7) TaxID=1247726 RepID=W0PCR5_ADVMD|nr:head-tail connector protein [Advenella mimigardefordensis]AHG63185.1 hypothetical protein MIM_c10870 [Advenella mimigardefordensis DPN7]